MAGLGWTKPKIEQFLWDNSQMPWSMVEKVYTALRREGYLANKEYGLAEGRPWPITKKTENILIVVTGGQHPTHSYWMQSSQGTKLANVRITLPPIWDDLIK